MLERIVSDADVLRGKPRVRGTRLSVEFLLELLASGASFADITQKYPHVTPDDVEAAVRYAARFLRNEVILTAETVA